MRRTRGDRRGALLACFLAAVLLGACDESFTPLEPSSLELSVFGYLDASADTQWIRLTPIRPLILTPSGPLAATVTLEEEGSDRVIELHDSVFRFSAPDTTVGSGGVYLHNYWTTEEIQPGATYRLAAKLEGKPPSEATIEVPADYGIELRTRAYRADAGTSVRLNGLRHVAFVIVVTNLTDACGNAFTKRVHFGTGFADRDTQMIAISRPVLSDDSGCGPSRVENQRVLIIGSGATWPTGDEYETGGLGVPEIPSNISNGIGYVGGVLTHTIPYDRCIFAHAMPGDICRLRYDSSAVTLRGTITDAACGEPLADATIELRELDPELPTRIRSAFSNSAGRYVIGALEPNEPYALSVTHERDRFQAQTDTLMFQPGEQATYDTALRGLVCEM